MAYLPHTDADRAEMLSAIGVQSIDDLFADLPANLRNPKIDLPPPLSELQLAEHLRDLETLNRRPQRNGDYFIGGGAYRHYIPAVVDEICARSEFYTAYTPYQPEISQGTLQAIFEYQTAIARITGMAAANASLYDAGTAIYEAVVMAINATKRDEIIYDTAINPHYREVLRSHTDCALVKHHGIAYSKNNDGNIENLANGLTKNTAAIIVQVPDFFGRVADFSLLAEKCRANKTLLIIVGNPLAFGLILSPAEMGADIAVGDAQPFGLSLNYGGPFLGYIACTQKLLRNLPGRIVGETVDKNNERGFVLTLQAREQHIRRERATSNICSNQALCALRALVYLTVMGKNGYQQVAQLCWQKAQYAREVLGAVNGAKIVFAGAHFNEFVLRVDKPVMDLFRKFGYTFEPGIRLNRWYPELADCLLVAVTELNRKNDLDQYALRLKEWLEN